MARKQFRITMNRIDEINKRVEELRITLIQNARCNGTLSKSVKETRSEINRLLLERDTIIENLPNKFTLRRKPKKYLITPNHVVMVNPITKTYRICRDLEIEFLDKKTINTIIKNE